MPSGSGVSFSSSSQPSPERVLDVDRARALGLVAERVDLLLAVVAVRVERAVDYAYGVDGCVLHLRADCDERAEVEREGDESLLFRLEAFEQRLARVRVAVYDRERAAFERQRRSVLEHQPGHRPLPPLRLAEDRDARALHARLQDGYQRRAVAAHGDGLLDSVLEEVAYLAALSAAVRRPSCRSSSPRRPTPSSPPPPGR